MAGKGGVGKTTISAVFAVAAARLGLSVLVVDIEGKSELHELLGGSSDQPRGFQSGSHRRFPWGFEDTLVAPGGEGRGAIHGRHIAADQALISYLEDHSLGRLASTMVDTGVIDVVTRSAPGIKDILVLGKIKQLERAAAADLIIVDAPASGHAITFLRAARGLLDAVSRGPINTQAREVAELLTDGDRCQVVLTTLAEETPVSELIETAYALEEDVGIKLGPLVINALYPPSDLPADPSGALRSNGIDPAGPEGTALLAAAQFRREREALQQEQLQRLGDTLPLPQLRLPYRFTPSLNAADVDALAKDLVRALAALPAL